MSERGKEMEMGLVIWTARVDYEAQGEEVVVNSTAGSGFGVGKVFNPGWDLVKASKAGEISWDEYVARYLAMLRQRWQTHRWAFEEVCNAGEVVLVCYCGRKKSGKRCHRYLLADVLVQAAERLGIEATYAGERLSYTNRRQSFDKK